MTHVRQRKKGDFPKDRFPFPTNAPHYFRCFPSPDRFAQTDRPSTMRLKLPTLSCPRLAALAALTSHQFYGAGGPETPAFFRLLLSCSTAGVGTRCLGLGDPPRLRRQVRLRRRPHRRPHRPDPCRRPPHVRGPPPARHVLLQAPDSARSEIAADNEQTFAASVRHGNVASAPEGAALGEVPPDGTERDGAGRRRWSRASIPLSWRARGFRGHRAVRPQLGPGPVRAGRVRGRHVERNAVQHQRVCFPPPPGGSPWTRAGACRRSLRPRGPPTPRPPRRTRQSSRSHGPRTLRFPSRGAGARIVAREGVTGSDERRRGGESG
jgi:hypothetical protein